MDLNHTIQNSTYVIINKKVVDFTIDHSCSDNHIQQVVYDMNNIYLISMLMSAQNVEYA